MIQYLPLLLKYLSAGVAVGVLVFLAVEKVDASGLQDLLFLYLGGLIGHTAGVAQVPKP